MKEAILFKQLPNNLVQCDACAWHCLIQEDKTGICGVRKNIKGTLYLLVYGYPISVNIDPIEKKPLYHFLPGTEIFSIGTVGCNFGCEFCQNSEISQASKAGKSLPKPKIILTPEDAVDYCVKHKIPSIAFTYNEPTIFAEYAVDVMKLAKPHGIKGVFVSNGYESQEALKFLNPYIDAYNIDLKSFSEDFYRNICKARLEPVLETIKELYRRKKWLEITTLIIPDKNDSKEELTKIAKFIKNISPDIPWHISAFHPDYKMTETSATPAETLFRAYEIGKKAGLNYVYTGNITDNRYNNTICLKCDSVIIERDCRYQTTKNSANGRCPKCKTKIPGIWK